MVGIVDMLHVANGKPKGNHVVDAWHGLPVGIHSADGWSVEILRIIERYPAINRYNVHV